MSGIISKRAMTKDKLKYHSMNERIRECWLKAAIEAAGEKWDSQEKFIERFAELIVRDCISICEQGNDTQTTSSGAALLIRQKYEIFD